MGKLGDTVRDNKRDDIREISFKDIVDKPTPEYKDKTWKSKVAAISIILVAVFLTFIMLMLDFPIFLSFLPIIIGTWVASKVRKSGKT